MNRARSIKPLTERQRQALDFISRQIHKDGRPPTLREIGAHFRIGSTNAVRTMLHALERKGYLRRRPYLSRGIELTRTVPFESSLVKVPIMGRIAAGQPLLAVENIEGELVLDRDLVRSDDGFALRVKGDSMVGAGIRDGDIVLARPNLPLSQGAIVVAVIGEEATVKHYYRERNRIRLEPASPHFDPIIISRNDPELRIAGRVVGLYRRY